MLRHSRQQDLQAAAESLKSDNDGAHRWATDLQNLRWGECVALLGNLAPWDFRSREVPPEEPQLEGEQNPAWADGLPTSPAVAWAGDTGTHVAFPACFKSMLSLGVGGHAVFNIIKRHPRHWQARHWLESKGIMGCRKHSCRSNRPERRH